MRRNAWKDIVNWTIKRLSSCTKSPLQAWATITSKRKNWKRYENCPTYAHKWSWNACIWPELVDLTSSKPCFTFLKTMKQWSRWSSRAEVRHWDTCPEPTESRLIRCLTESTWTPKIQTEYVDAINKPKAMSKRQQEDNSGGGTCGGQIEAHDEFGIEDCQSVSNTGFECIFQAWETRCGNDNHTLWYKVVSPQLPDIQLWPSWESLLKWTTDIESFWRGQNAGHRCREIQRKTASMCNSIDWTTDANLEWRILQKLRRTQTDFRRDIGHFFGPRTEEKLYGTRTKRFVEHICRDDNASFPRNWTSYPSSNRCVGPRIFEKQERRNVIDSPHRWLVDRRVFFRTVVSVRRTCSANLWSFVFQHWETLGEYECRLSPDVVSISTNPPSTNEPAQGTCCEFMTKNSKRFQRKYECLKLAKPLVLWERFLLDNVSWHGWWIWGCWVMPRIYVTSKWWRFFSDRMDSRTHENWPSTGSQGHATRGLSFPEGWTSVWNNLTKKMENLFTAKRWLPVWRNPLRQNTRYNQVHHRIPSPRCS